MNSQGSRVFARDVVVALAVVGGLYALAEYVRFRPFQIPGYLLIVGFDVLERTFWAAGGYYHVWFAAYLVGLGVVGALATQLVRRRGPADLPGWRLAAASAVGLVGTLALLFGVAVLVGTGQVNPFLITGTVGAALLALAAVVGGVVDAV